MSDDKPAAVYVSWVTFKSALESLAQGIPNQIDRSSFPGMSGGVQSQLFAGLKFLRLMNEDSRPTPTLHTLAVADEGARKAALKTILEERYADLFALGLTKTTPKELADTMASSYNVSGDTKEKAVRFFVQAALYVGIPLSRFLNVPNANTSTPRVRTRRLPKAKPEATHDPAPKARSTSTGPERTIELESGGTLTLTADFDPFQLSPKDREFVYGVIDALRKYEEGQSPEQEEQNNDDIA